MPEDVVRSRLLNRPLQHVLQANEPSRPSYLNLLRASSQRFGIPFAIHVAHSCFDFMGACHSLSTRAAREGRNGCSSCLNSLNCSPCIEKCPHLRPTELPGLQMAARASQPPAGQQIVASGFETSETHRNSRLDMPFFDT